MPERVVAADRDDSRLRVNGRDKGRRRSVLRTMMANFQDVGPQVVAERQYLRLAGLARIAHEQFAKIVVVQHRYDAVFVHVIARFGQKRQ